MRKYIKAVHSCFSLLSFPRPYQLMTMEQHAGMETMISVSPTIIADCVEEDPQDQGICRSKKVALYTYGKEDNTHSKQY